MLFQFIVQISLESVWILSSGVKGGIEPQCYRSLSEWDEEIRLTSVTEGLP